MVDLMIGGRGSGKTSRGIAWVCDGIGPQEKRVAVARGPAMARRILEEIAAYLDLTGRTRKIDMLRWAVSTGDGQICVMGIDNRRVGRDGLTDELQQLRGLAPERIWIDDPYLRANTEGGREAAMDADGVDRIITMARAEQVLITVTPCPDYPLLDLWRPWGGRMTDVRWIG